MPLGKLYPSIAVAIGPRDSSAGAGPLRGAMSKHGWLWAEGFLDPWVLRVGLSCFLGGTGPRIAACIASCFHNVLMARARFWGSMLKTLWEPGAGPAHW